MTVSELKNQLNNDEEIIVQFVKLSVTQQENLKPYILELFVKKKTSFQKQQLQLCCFMSFSIKEYVSSFKTVPEYYFEENLYQQYRPKWFQAYLDDYLKNKDALELKTIAELIDTYDYSFEDNLVMKKLISLDTKNQINPKKSFEKTVVLLLSNFPKFTKKNIYLVFTEEAETYFDEAPNRSFYKDFYIEIDSWIKIAYELYTKIGLDRLRLIRTCLYGPSKDLRTNTRIWLFKLLSKLKPSPNELKQLEKEMFSSYMSKNLQLLKTCFAKPKIIIDDLKEFFVPELRYEIDPSLDAKKEVHHNELPIFDGFTTIEAKCEILQHLTTLKKHSKKAYIPMTQNIGAEHSIHSKFGGLPYLLTEDDYPKCSNCGKDLQLMLQLNLGDLPERDQKGLVQVFFCTNQKTNCESKSLTKNTTTGICRKITPNGNSCEKTPNLQHLFPERRISKFIQFVDYPHHEDYDSLGISIQVPDNIYDFMLRHNIGTTSAGDKLFGYPHWLQSSAFTNNLEFIDHQLLFQLASNDNLPFMFGDSGTGYLLEKTKTNKDMNFIWQSH